MFKPINAYRCKLEREGAFRSEMVIALDPSEVLVLVTKQFPQWELKEFTAYGLVYATSTVKALLRGELTDG
jgi:hypothetical protein